MIAREKKTGIRSINWKLETRTYGNKGAPSLNLTLSQGLSTEGSLNNLGFQRGSTSLNNDRIK